jgi:methyl-accepting chemotaxis protein
MKQQTNMAQMVAWYGVVVCVGFLITIGTSIFALTTLKVGGPVYEELTDSKDLSSEMMPPYLAMRPQAHLAARAATGLVTPSAYEAELAKVKASYQERIAYWKSRDLSPDLRARLAAVEASADKQWGLLEEDIPEALKTGDRAAAEAILRRIEAAYVEHKAIVDPLITLVDGKAKDDEKLARDESVVCLTILGVVSTVILAIMAIGVIFIRKRIVELTAAEQRNKDALQELANQFENSVGSVVDIVASAATELESTARTMESTAGQTSAQSTAVAAAAEQATTNVSIVATSADEMGKSVSEIAHQVAQSASIASDAVNRARMTGETMEELSRSAEKIGDVVSLISDIAAQTNLLALNATIESARAGEAGKGFAVVASEVKNLATQTAKATDEIGSQIEEMQTISRASVTAIAEIQKIIDEMNAISVTINAAVEEQSAATHEIARSTNEAANGAHDVARNISQVLEAAQHTGAASSQVVGAAQQLGEQAEVLRGEVSNFLKTVRAA